MDSPNCNSNVSRQFLAKALGLEWEIDSYNVAIGTKPGDNFMSVIYSAEVQAKDKKGGNTVTQHLLIKCYPTQLQRQQSMNKSNMFFKEMEIYRIWMPELRRFQTEVIGLEKAIKLPYAPFVHGKCIDFESAKENEYNGKVLDSLDNYIIMEDLRKTRGFRMTNPRKGIDICHMKLVIHELAKIHSMSWAYKTHVEKDLCKKFPCLVKRFSPEARAKWKDIAIGSIGQAILTLEEALGAGNDLSNAMKGFKSNVESVVDVFLGFKEEEILDSLLRVKHDERFGTFSLNQENWRVICHGDCWSNNLLFRYDEKTGRPVELVLVDLQISREACIMPDLVCIIYGCTDATLRKNHLNELMELYVNTFNYFCRILKTDTLPGFGIESFKHRFHRYKMIGLFMAVIDFPTTLKETVEEQQETNSKGTFSAGSNTLYKERLLELIQELYGEGVI